MEIKYLTEESVLNIHEKILEDTKEDTGLAPNTSLDSALYRIVNHITYNGMNDIYEMAALYGVAIAKGHCFNNGNKRTALVSMLTFLFLNGIEIEVSNEIIEELMVEIATDKVKESQLTRWLKEHSVNIQT